jgi:arylsulfatase A
MLTQRTALYVFGLLLFGISDTFAAASKPNILFILADDMGYGDIQALNPEGKIPTPQLNGLAASGMAFTDAHSSSSVCTPTRYGILTGRYNWRSRLPSGVLGGLSPALIEDGRLTVAAMLRSAGYTTACIGKWHLGLEWELQPEKPPFSDKIEQGHEGWNADFSKPFKKGPTALGFDFFFGISASLDMVPYTFLENDRVTVVPTTDKDFPMTQGHERARTRRGPAAPDFEAEQVLPTLTSKAESFIRSHAAQAKAGKPFFLYLPLNSPHTPILPSKEWQGKSGISPYADFVMQTDDSVGKLLKALKEEGIDSNTLVFFTSDNGCSPAANLDQLNGFKHNPNFQFRGAKADIFEGGHRVPFLVSWPDRIAPGSKSAQLTCLNDFFATCAEIVGEKIPDNAAEDSISLLPVLEGRSDGARRESLVHHSINGSFAIRKGPWKLELCPDSGGWSEPKPRSASLRSLPKIQLYNLAKDLEEGINLQHQHPEVVEELTQLLEKIAFDGRSTPGPIQLNSGLVELHRFDGTKKKSQP